MAGDSEQKANDVGAESQALMDSKRPHRKETLSNMTSAEERRWRWSAIAIQAVSILAPFGLAFWLLTCEKDSQREYEREKLSLLLSHLSSEIQFNESLVKSDSLLRDVRPVLMMLSWGEGLGYKYKVPRSRFQTDVWDAAIGKDYFFLVDSAAINQAKMLYSAFRECNEALDRFAAGIEGLRAQEWSKEKRVAEMTYEERIEVDLRFFDTQTEKVKIDNYLSYIKEHAPSVREILGKGLDKR